MSVPTLIRGSFETEGWQYKELSSIRGRVGNWRGRSESPSEPRFQLPPHHT